MTTCKDCIHYEACFEYGNILDPIHGGVICDSFKNKADIAEVQHGKWTIKRDEYDCEYMVCSCCAECFYDGDNDTVDRLPKYCSECGAKMDGGKK